MIFITTSIITNAFSQGTPPAAGKQRGMYVGCGDVLIQEIRDNGNVYDTSGSTPITHEFFNYCEGNYFNYIAVYSLAKKMNGGSSLIGDSTYWDALREFLKTAHSKNIQVGMVVTNKEFLNSSTLAPTTTFFTSPFYYNLQQPLYNCGYDTIDPLDFAIIGNDAMNDIINPVEAEIFNNDPAEVADLLPTVYPQLEKAELCKSVLQLLKYSFQTKYWHYQNNDCAECNETQFSELQAPPLANYLFDFISIEYEYWDNNTWDKFNTDSLKTKQKRCWDNFVVLTKSAFYAQKMMCGQLQTELELKLTGPFHDSTLTDPIHPWDTAAGNVPIPPMQAAFMGKYYNRILLSDYKKNYSYPNMISLVGAGMKWLSDNPSSLTPKTEIMPVFSAARLNEEKHCFGNYLLDTSNVPLTWSFDFFGYWLKNASYTNTPGSNFYYNNELRFFELEFLLQCDSATYTWFLCDHCENDNGANAQCTFDMSNDTIIGFMWYNYSTLNNTTSGSFTHQYHRMANKVERMTANENKLLVNYSSELNTLAIFKPGKNVTCSLSIYDVNGKLIYTHEQHDEMEFISLQFLVPGIYFTQVVGNAAYITKKITVIR